MISYYLNRCIPPQCVVVGPEIISRLVNEVIFEMVDVRMYTDQLEHPWKVRTICFCFLEPFVTCLCTEARLIFHFRDLGHFIILHRFRTTARTANSGTACWC